MSQLPTVRVLLPDGREVIINQSDYDRAKHKIITHTTEKVESYGDNPAPPPSEPEEFERQDDVLPEHEPIKTKGKILYRKAARRDT